MRMPR